MPAWLFEGIACLLWPGSVCAWVGLGGLRARFMHCLLSFACLLCPAVCARGLYAYTLFMRSCRCTSASILCLVQYETALGMWQGACKLF